MPFTKVTQEKEEHEVTLCSFDLFFFFNESKSVLETILSL